jgi:hypothetical protein
VQPPTSKADAGAGQLTAHSSPPSPSMRADTPADALGMSAERIEALLGIERS